MTRTALEYFEEMYRKRADPWGFASRWYEQRKYALTVASLPLPTYQSAFEPGCAIGALSEHLAPRCHRLLAVDHMARAVSTATLRLQRFPQVRVEQRTVPEDWPEERFDLLVLSELCYYFDLVELRRLVERAQRSLEVGATVVAVHWTGQTDYPLTGAQTHRALTDTSSFEGVIHHVDEEFLLDVWRYRP